jgi:hypothetical protein
MEVIAMRQAQAFPSQQTLGQIVSTRLQDVECTGACSLSRIASSTAIPQSIPEFVVIGFGDLPQQMGLIFLQEIPKQFFFFGGQPEFHHGNLP